jgi:crotonobetainyl-CoA:carnitine CoA-transferase CaiB-like acyl-CoA transferase
MLEQAWHALDGERSLLPLVELSVPRQPADSALPVAELASASVGAATLAAAELLAARRQEAERPVIVDGEHALAAFASERHIARDGRPVGPGWDSLSRFLPTADGWIRLQCNYPHHRERALAALGGPVLPEQAVAACSRRGALELEEAIVAAGGCAAAVRGTADWAAHPQGEAIATTRLIGLRPLADAPATPPDDGPVAAPAQGVRVLDLTRVIAGPACTRFLAAHGAEVLRVDNPRLPELPGHHLDANWGKRSTRLDLTVAADRARFERLLADADVLVQGYRPGALERLGLGPEAVAAHHPGLVVVSICAWGASGPWGRRRGFDSIVQAATGIAQLEADARALDAPGALPVQALDHGTAYLAAAGVLRALSLRRRVGGGWAVELSLARTARWLLDQPASVARPAAVRSVPQDPAANVASFRFTRASVHGPLTAIRPPGLIRGERPPAWATPPGAYGADPPAWNDEGDPH